MGLKMTSSYTKKYPFIAFLKKQYGLFEPHYNRRAISIGISCFIWFMLFSFGLFDLDYFPVPRRFFVTGVYSLFSFFTLAFNLFVLQDRVMKKYTIGSTMGWIFWNIFCIANSNFLITTVLFRFEPFSLFVFIKDQMFTIILGLVITPLFILIHYNFILKQRISELFNVLPQNPVKEDLNEIILFQSEYKNDSLSINPDCLLFIKSADNYIDVYYILNNLVVHKLIRNTLASIEQRALHPDLVRCHRSYIVNKQKIRTIEGNSTGYTILLNGYQVGIPFSKKYKKTVLLQKN
jgi:hypothetical protein